MNAARESGNEELSSHNIGDLSLRRKSNFNSTSFEYKDSGTYHGGGGSNCSVGREIIPLKENVSKMIRATSCISTIHSIVQELIMNSIDSGATNIDIEIGSDEGSFSLNVTDNGSGISKSNMNNLGIWHFSSKFQDEKTLGFRGEALASISSFSNVVVTSKVKSSESSYSIDINSRSIKFAPSKFSYSSGTSVQVNEIFENIPVRKGVINIGNEIQKIKTFVYNMALLRHNIGWSIRKAGVRRSITALNPQSSVAGRIIEQFGQEIMSKMMPISISLHDFHIQGFMSPLASENCHWNKSCQSLFLNGRWLSSNDLFSGAFNFIYNSLLSTNRSGGPAAKHFNPFSSQVKYCPAFVLQIQCSSNSYDILSEPDKTVPLFHNCTIVKELIYNTVLTAASNCRISEAKIHQFMESFSLSNYGRHSTLKIQLEPDNLDSSNDGMIAENITVYLHENDELSNKEEKSAGEIGNYTIITSPKAKGARLTSADLFDYAFFSTNSSNVSNDSSNISIPVEDCNSLGKRCRDIESSSSTYDDEFENGSKCNYENFTSVNSGEISRDHSRENRIDSYFADSEEEHDAIGHPSCDADNSNTYGNDVFDIRHSTNDGWEEFPAQSEFIAATDSGYVNSSNNSNSNSNSDNSNTEGSFIFADNNLGNFSFILSDSINTAPEFTSLTSTKDDFAGPDAIIDREQPSRLYKFDNKISKSLLKSSRFLGQVDSKYILITTSDGNLIAMDQHAASERVLYEELDLNFQSKLITTKVVDHVVLLNHNEAEFCEKKAKTIEFWGFEFKVLWNDYRQKSSFVKVRISKVAQIHGEPLTGEDFKEYISTLMSKGDLFLDILQKPPAFHRIIASKSCKAAVKFGDTLSNDQCTNLISDLSNTSLPFQCAHGRPSIAPLIKVRTASTQPQSLNFDNVMKTLNSSVYGIGSDN